MQNLVGKTLMEYELDPDKKVLTFRCLEGVVTYGAEGD